jgi:hypothetical protein
MRNIGVLLLLIFVASCSSRKLTLEEFAKQPVKVDKQKVSYPNNDFSLYIPKNWVWKVEKYDNENIILGIDASSPPSKEGFIDLISIQKVKSFGGVKDLKSEYNYLLNLAKNQSNNMKLVESGETEILKQKAYYIHSKSASNTVGESEMLSFVLASPSEGIFYYITAGSSQTNDLMKNMSIIIQSIKTFEINKID